MRAWRLRSGLWLMLWECEGWSAGVALLLECEDQGWVGWNKREDYDEVVELCA